MQTILDELYRELDNLREPPGGYDKIVDRFSNIAVLDHERKTQWRRIAIALRMSDLEVTRTQLQQIENDFHDYGQLIVDSAMAARDLDGKGNVLHNALPISADDQQAFEIRCSELRTRVLDALKQSGFAASEPAWLL
ncbi:MAG TPA: hypothetical protein VMA98_11700 [Candidatus Acidoferrales bacterium]|nr:hypothetical protein [Candidatus Acidoferrales bacterium]